MKSRIGSIKGGSIWILFLIYLTVATKLILFKEQIGKVDYSSYNFGIDSLKNSVARASFLPLRTTLGLMQQGLSMFVIQNIGGNILIFIPLGIFVPILVSSFRSSYKILIASLALSFAFESLQLLFFLGVFDVDDILLNTIGGIIGFGVYKLSLRFLRPQSRCNRTTSINIS